MPADTSDQDFLRSKDVAVFIHDSADEYIDQWSRALEKAGTLDNLLGHAPFRLRFTGWNWGGFLFAPFWLAYRKLWTLLLIVVTVGLTPSFFDISGPFSYAPGVLMGFIMGVWGNTLYLKHVRARVNEVRHLTTDEDARTILLSKAGGTSWGGVVAVLVGVLAAGIAEDWVSNLGDETAIASVSDVDTSSFLPEWVAEIDGVWQDGDGKQMLIHVREDKAFLYDLRGESPLKLYPKIVALDEANDSIIFSAQSAANGTNDDLLWTLRKEWNDDKTKFSLRLMVPNQAAEDLSYVRPVLENEAAEIIPQGSQ